MPQFELSPVAQQWTNVVLIWLGFGILTGLLAKSLIPGREPADAMGTLVLGVAGAFAGPLALSLALKANDFNPIGPLGLLASVGAAIVLLLAYRLVALRVAAGETEEADEMDGDKDDWAH